MGNHDHSTHEPSHPERFWRSRSGIVLAAFLAIAAFLLIFEHRAHVFTSNGFLALLLVACIGMHFFMHSSHGGRGGGSAADGDRRDGAANSRK